MTNGTTRAGLLLLVGAGAAALVLIVRHGFLAAATGRRPTATPHATSPTVVAPTLAAPAREAPQTGSGAAPDAFEVVLFLEGLGTGDDTAPRDAHGDARATRPSDATGTVTPFRQDLASPPAPLAAPPQKAATNDPTASTEPRERHPEPASPDALETLQNAFRLECDFAAGRGWWGSMESLAAADADYRGDLIVYHAIDLAAGTARMTGTLGVTGSRKGEIDARVTATPLGVYFSHVEPTGRLVVTSVLAHLRRGNVYLAVFTQYGAVDAYLYRGVCTAF